MRKVGIIALAIGLASGAVSPSYSAQTDADLFVINVHAGFVDWYWKSPPSSPVTSYTISFDDSSLTFKTNDDYFVPADQVIPNLELKKFICVEAKLADGFGITACQNMINKNRPSGQVINFAGPSSIYRVDGIFLKNIGGSFEGVKSEPKGIDGNKFSATDSVYLNTNIYFLNPPYMSKVIVCDLNNKCTDRSKLVNDYWVSNQSPNYLSAKVSTPDACAVVSTQLIEGGQLFQEIKPLRDNVDCDVIASSRVPFLSKSDITATFSIHFQKLPASLLIQLPTGELNPTVGTFTFLEPVQIPIWNWLKQRNFSSASTNSFPVQFAADSKSLTPKICSISLESKSKEIIDLKGKAPGQCQIEISLPKFQSNNQNSIQKIIPITTYSEAEKRVIAFKVTRPKVNSNQFVSKYPCMVADPDSYTFKVFNLSNKSAAPKNCQANNAYISIYKGD